ncbi:ECF transporter S component [Bengtsoniella intestinalis]|uniref:ECF transporter S component n=1 Tax=Bengtsoniella intestinalis TaxID=3073143 RepID=UPI00391F20A3
MSNSNAATLSQSKTNTRTLTTSAMLVGIAYVVMLMSKMIPSFNGFLDFDFKDVIICMGGFTYGPAAAAIMAIAVSLLEMITVSHTGLIGLIMNILATCSFCCTASFVYKKFHTKTGAIVGLGLGVVALTAIMLLWNYLITPLYMAGFSRSDIAAMLVPIFLPFNLLKGGMNMAATLMLYKPIITALRKARLVPEAAQTALRSNVNVGWMLLGCGVTSTLILIGMVVMGMM